MPNIITLRTIGGTDDKRISLSNGQIGRPFNIPGGWNNLRIGLRWCSTDNDASIGSNPHLAVGLCSGTTNMLLDATTTHFVGVCSAWSGGYTTGRNAGPPVYYTPNFAATKRVGNVATVASTYGGALFRIHADPVGGYRTWFIVDITKGSPNYTVKMFCASGVAADADLAGLLLRMEESSPSFASYTYASSSVAANEATDGVLNAVNIAWDRSAPAIEISDIVVARMS